MAVKLCFVVVLALCHFGVAEQDVRLKRSVSLVPLNAKEATKVLQYAAPAVDFPIFSQIPLTSFTCQNIQPGTYASDPETGCQAFHLCDLSRALSASFLCPNYTIFNDQTQVCEWFHNVDCSLRWTGAVSVTNTIRVIPVATISSSQSHNLGEIQTSQSSLTSSGSTASKNCDEKPGLVVPVIQEVKTVVPVIPVTTEINNPHTNFVPQGNPQGGFPNAVAHIGESHDIHVSETVRPVTAVVAQPVAILATVESNMDNELQTSSSSRNSKSGSSSVTTQAGEEVHLKPVAVIVKPVVETTKSNSEIPVKPTVIPSSVIDTSKTISETSHASHVPHTATGDLGSGISTIQAKSGWGAKSSPAVPTGTLLAIQETPQTPQTAQTLGYNGGQNFVGNGMHSSPLGMGAIQMLHPAQQIQLYSQGVANPFIVDPFFAPLRMYSGIAGAFLPYTLGMLGR